MSQAHHQRGPSAAPAAAESADRDRGRLLAAGGILGAVLASSCCVAPLLLVTIGVSGAWIGNLTALQPYKPYVLSATALLLGLGFWHVYFKGKRKRECTQDGYCALPGAARATKSVLWVAALLALLSATVGIWAPWFY